MLSVIKAQSQYFMPYRRTKIMNEGWATFWHEKIMQRLFAEKFLDAEDHGYYNLYNARVKAHHPAVHQPVPGGKRGLRGHREPLEQGALRP